jgi:hypothetical protein
MADMTKLKKRNSLGEPPEEASNNLVAPEVAPVAPPQNHIDGRSLRTRRSTRTIQFSTKVTPEFDARIRQIAHRDGLLLTELLEEALNSYENNKKLSG